MEVVDGREWPVAFAVRACFAGQLGGERDHIARRECVSRADAPVIWPVIWPVIRDARLAQLLRDPRDRLPAGERQLGEDRIGDRPRPREDVRAFCRRCGKAAKPEVELRGGAGMARLEQGFNQLCMNDACGEQMGDARLEMCYQTLQSAPRKRSARAGQHERFRGRILVRLERMESGKMGFEICHRDRPSKRDLTAPEITRYFLNYR
ncbi:MAG: hypothetical protein EBR34_07935 [Sphingomonadaceae bacterium]|nr:hypothetical protein [Sphingomonadaceae bacterium]